MTMRKIWKRRQCDAGGDGWAVEQELQQTALILFRLIEDSILGERNNAMSI